MWFTSLTRLYEQFAGTLLHWQTVNVQYIFYLALMIVALCLIISSLSSHWRTGPLLLAGWGFLVGGGPLLGLSALIVVPFVLFGYLRPAGRRRLLVTIASFVFATVPRLIFGVSTPGARIRRGYLDEPDYVQAVLNSISDLPLTGLYWASALVSLPNLTAIVFGVVLAAVFQDRQGEPTNFIKKQELKLAITLLMASIVIFLVNSVLEELVYPAFWHTITSRMLLFLASIVFGSLVFAQGVKAANNLRKGGGTIL